MIYLTLAIFSGMLLCAIEPVTVKEAMFEINSAIATVGSTLGITPHLGSGGRFLIILLMYVGRLGGLTFTLIFARQRPEPPIDRPTGKLLIG